MTSGAIAGQQKVAIILHSGAYDRASYALSLGLVALASGMDVHLLLTYDGLRRFTKGHLADIGEETDARTAVSIRKGLTTGGVQTLEAQLRDARALGLKVYACPNAMAALNIAQSDLIDDVDEIMGLAGFLQLARDATINWYI
jgi:peroxiredoxin family protein